MVLHRGTGMRGNRLAQQDLQYRSVSEARVNGSYDENGVDAGSGTYLLVWQAGSWMARKLTPEWIA